MSYKGIFERLDQDKAESSRTIIELPVQQELRNDWKSVALAQQNLINEMNAKVETLIRHIHFMDVLLKQITEKG